MKKEKKEDQFIKQPFYKGGNKALQEFIASQLKYPPTSLKNKVEGDVHIRYAINHKGIVTDTHIIGGLDDACNDEAARVVSLLRFEVPKTPRNMRVIFHKTIRIHFRLPVNAPSSPRQIPGPGTPVTAYTYTIVHEKKEDQPAPSKTITYTIRY
jgi:protein TonB